MSLKHLNEVKDLNNKYKELEEQAESQLMNLTALNDDEVAEIKAHFEQQRSEIETDYQHQFKNINAEKQKV